MDYDRIVFTQHAIRRMFEWRLGVADIETTIKNGEVIVDYSDDRPFPSALILAFVRGEPVHVVAALNEPARTCYVVTAYRPDPPLWTSDFRRRRST